MEELELLTENVEVHQTLGDNPNTDDNLSAYDLKVKFDEPARILKQFLNSKIIPFINTLHKQTTQSIDPTLTLEGFAADAKKTGDALAERAFAKRTVNGYPLTGDINLNAADIEAAPAGFGLGAAKLISMAEIDSIASTGWYYSDESATLGGYTSNRWWMQVLAYGSGTTFATQRIITFSSGLGHELVRHKINGTWGEWEWVNPPVAVGVEYRTTDRLFGAPVYKKAISLGGTSTTALSVEHGITGIDYPISCTLLNADGAYTNNVTAIEFTKTNVNVTLLSGGTGGKVVYAILEYTVSR